ncbi:MAG: hypothetical protein BWZ10_03269 [candidate division BRC1 bacterium ADurb.BinA364]|nr:MAG: hypothetical protein BWZ10_03269 [candidate division BRC1 bacterium ADurb.BinA364]
MRLAGIASKIEQQFVQIGVGAIARISPVCGPHRRARPFISASGPPCHNMVAPRLRFASDQGHEARSLHRRMIDAKEVENRRREIMAQDEIGDSHSRELLAWKTRQTQNLGVVPVAAFVPFLNDLAMIEHLRAMIGNDQHKRVVGGSLSLERVEQAAKMIIHMRQLAMILRDDAALGFLADVRLAAIDRQPIFVPVRIVGIGVFARRVPRLMRTERIDPKKKGTAARSVFDKTDRAGEQPRGDVVCRAAPVSIVQQILAQRGRARAVRAVGFLPRPAVDFVGCQNACPPGIGLVSSNELPCRNASRKILRGLEHVVATGGHPSDEAVFQ